MQESKNKRQLLMLVVLTCATITALWLNSRGRQDNDTEKNIFKDYDLKEVNQVKLESAGGVIDLAFKGARWNVNSQFPADPAMIEVLFATLEQAEPKRPVAATLKDSVAERLRRDGVKVSLSMEGNLIKSFYAGGNTAKSQAYFMSPDESIPYLMTIPGYRVYVSGIFELNASGWRDKHIFAFNWRNFQELQATFPQKSSGDFSVAMVDRILTIPGLQTVDTTRLNEFLDQISLLTADEFAAPERYLDSLASTKPVVSILVKDVGGKQFQLSLYAPREKGKRFPGLVNGEQWAFFQEDRILGLIRPRSFFGK